MLCKIQHELYKIKKDFLERKITRKDYEETLNQLIKNVEWDLLILNRDLKNVG